jgi:hypothetical protein
MLMHIATQSTTTTPRSVTQHYTALQHHATSTPLQLLFLVKTLKGHSMLVRDLIFIPKVRNTTERNGTPLEHH